MVAAQLLADRARRRALGLACAPPGALDPMKPNPSAAPADPVLLALLAAWLVAEALITLLVAAAAVILTLVGWRPAPPPVPPPPALPPPVLRLELLRVVELRALARAAGLHRLAQSGRRVELLQALRRGPG